MPRIDPNNPFYLISHNEILLITLMVWVVAQGVKMMLYLLRGKKFNFRWFIGTGGMPSSHAAGVTALATSCGLVHGFGSGIFALATVFAMVTMFDAQGVRRSTGEQAGILNKVLEDMYWHKRFEIGRIREFVGHTPFQVFVGSALGIGLAILFHGRSL
ncbi:MAG: divergent PAP2 family protein [Candidatus Omnitrophica bacterium]|nr:divergent PAP2 family protein [Candidatus Omnitrophota bacterium]